MRNFAKVYKNYVCPKCFYSLDKCKCSLIPQHYLIHIDRNIQEHIRILNTKGYKTVGCCESHYDNNYISLHINFAGEYNFNDIIMIPDGFKYDRNKRVLVFEFANNLFEDEYNFIKEDVLKRLLNWCNSLEVIS